MLSKSMPWLVGKSLLDSWWIFLMLLIGGSLAIFWGEWWAKRERLFPDLRGTMRSPWLKFLPAVMLGGGAIIGLSRAWSTMWIGDDAFITLRYSQMFARGEGLVFNSGEWVEGYTNFLWTLLLGFSAKLGASLPHVAILGNLISYLGVIAFVWLICRRLRVSTLPAVVVSCSYPMISFATSGLETMPAVMCVLLGVFALANGGLLLSGLAMVCAAMMRPDHILFWGCGGLSLLIHHLISRSGPVLSRLVWSQYLRYSAGLMGLYIPYFIWRSYAYGAFFPNTYYAKSGHLSYWSQGGVYLGSFLLGSGAWWICVVMLVACASFAWKKFKGNAVRFLDDQSLLNIPDADDSGERSELYQLRFQIFLFCILSLFIFGGYVVKVGGDFMLFRFLVVLFPLFWLTLMLITRRDTWGRISVLLAIAFALTPLEVVPARQKKWNLAAEETFYKVNRFIPLQLSSRYSEVGQDLKLLKEQVDGVLNVAIDCVGMIGYYADVRVFDLFGLTSPRVAHKKLHRRGRPGHEKFGDIEDALAEGSTLSNVDLWKRARIEESPRFTQFKVQRSTFHLLQYDERIIEGMTRLRSKRIRVTPPMKPSSAIVSIHRLTSESPNPRLAQFFRRFYGPALAQYPLLEEAIGGLERGEVPQKLTEKAMKMKQGDTPAFGPTQLLTEPKRLGATRTLQRMIRPKIKAPKAAKKPSP